MVIILYKLYLAVSSGGYILGPHPSTSNLVWRQHFEKSMKSCQRGKTRFCSSCFSYSIKAFYVVVANGDKNVLTEFDQLSNSVVRIVPYRNMLLGTQLSSGSLGIRYYLIFDPETFQAAPIPSL